MFFGKCRMTLCMSVILFLCFSVIAKEQPALSFSRAIKLAQQNDPWLTGNIHQQRATESMSVATNTLPDPKITISLANLPTNGYDLAQEGMTQVKVGIAQVFPRGDSLSIKRQQLSIQSETFPFQRQEREAKIALTVGSLWLDAYNIQKSISLVEKNKTLFQQLVQITESAYSSVLANTQQQDIISAQIELTRIEERLVQLQQERSNIEGKLLQWIAEDSLNETSQSNNLFNITLSQTLPEIALTIPKSVLLQNNDQAENLVQYFSNHPAIIAIDKKVNATKKGIELAQQKYKPEWGISASYGYRQDDPMGNSRADLFSLGVTFDLPIFTENKQDKEVQSAIYLTEAIKTEKTLLIRQLVGAFSSAKGRLHHIKNRQELYQAKLLPQVIDQAKVSLNAYSNNDGGFTAVIRAHIAVLNAEIDHLMLTVEKQKLHLELNYLFAGKNNKNTMNFLTYSNSKKMQKFGERPNGK
ncbi:TolC family protein [Thalassotalea profundi]|uniref:PTS cellobiose transporter subunit IIC n=1 Tax=Thalassotalea profundi TaxID=2036687 RepID=A0ABQ3IU23_9GAMM|nr:TolC family protein [Thalassotalea profundi]GHE89292.1 PTS cellobiose transporter subunit IIC [Thalassotalea profundi]